MQTLAVWCLWLCLAGSSQPHMITGVVDSIKKFSENDPWSLSNRNTPENSGATSTPSKSSLLTGYLTPTATQEVENKYQTENQSKFEQVKQNDGPDVEYFDLKIRGNPKETPTVGSEADLTYYKTFLKSLELFVGKDDYSVDEGLAGGQRSNIYNVTYTVPIPNTNEYHDITLPYLNLNQYDQTNSMFKEYLAKISKKESTFTSPSIGGLAHMDVDTNHKHVIETSTYLDSLELGLNQTPGTPVQKKFVKDPTNSNYVLERAQKSIFTSEGYNHSMKSFSSKSVHDESLNKTTPFTDSFLPLVVNKNVLLPEMTIADFPMNKSDILLADSNKITNLYKHSNLDQENNDIFVRNGVNSLQEVKDVLNAQDWFDFSKYISNLDILTDPDTAYNAKYPVADSSDIITAANWLVYMHRKLEEEQTLLTERYKTYIKEQIQAKSVLCDKEKLFSVLNMKEDNTLGRIRDLMLGYFKSLNLTTQEHETEQHLALLFESVLSSTNIFELLESSSKFVEQSLKSKQKVEQEVEPTEPKDEVRRFLKRVIEKQYTRCYSKLIDDGPSKKVDDNTTVSAYFSKLVESGGLTTFMECLNLRVQKCIPGFSLWLKKEMFHLRDEFRLIKAYAHYEWEQNLACFHSSITWTNGIIDTEAKGKKANKNVPTWILEEENKVDRQEEGNRKNRLITERKSSSQSKTSKKLKIPTATAHSKPISIN